MEKLPYCNGTNATPCERASAGKRRTRNEKENKRWAFNIIKLNMLSTTIIAETRLETEGTGNFLRNESYKFPALDDCRLGRCDPTGQAHQGQLTNRHKEMQETCW